MPQNKLLHLFSCQPMFLLFVYFLTVPEFILLFQTVIFHICIYFTIEMVLGLQRLFAGCYSASLFPAHCSNTHLPCRFIPSPHTAEHCLSFFKAALGYCSIPFKVSTKPCLWFAGLVKRERGKTDWEEGTLMTVTTRF